MHDSIIELLSAERLFLTKRYLRRQEVAEKILLVPLILVIVTGVLLELMSFSLIIIFVLYATTYYFAVMSSDLTTSINEIWRRYILYRLKNSGWSGGEIKLPRAVKIEIKRLRIILYTVVLFLLATMNYFGDYLSPLFFSYYVRILISIIMIYISSLIIREIALPSASFTRLEVSLGRKENFDSQRSLTLVMIFLSLVMVYLAYLISSSVRGRMNILILNAFYLLSGLILGKVILIWYRALFSIENNPLLESPLLLMIPLVEIFPVYYSLRELSKYVLVWGIEITFFNQLYFPLVILLTILFLYPFNVRNIILASKRDVDHVRNDIDLESYFLDFWRGKALDYLRKFLLVILLASLLSVILVANDRGFDFISLWSNNEIYTISIASLLLGIYYGYIKYAKSIIYYCLENLEYERRIFVNEHRRSEVIGIETKRSAKKDQYVEEMEDFDSILRDLERILEEE